MFAPAFVSASLLNAIGSMLPTIHSASSTDHGRNNAAPSHPCLPLAPDATPSESADWKRALPDAKALFGELEGTRHPDQLDRQVSVESRHAPALPVNPRTLLKQGTNQTDLASLPLHANWVGEGRLVMATPVHAEAGAWAQACLEHGISAVVSLGTKAEHDSLYPCMENNGPIVANGQWVDFVDVEECGPSDGSGEQNSARADLRTAHPDAMVRSLTVERGLGDGSKRKATARQELSNFLVPTRAEHAISPRTLLATCRALHDEVGGGAIAFQSPGGDHRGAVFAAAHGLFQQFVEGRLDSRNLERRVLQQCIDLRATRSATLFDRQDHLASLLTMCRMMLSDRRGRPAGTPVAMRTPEVVGNPPDPARAPQALPRSAMKGARLLAHGEAPPRPAVRFASDVVDNGHASRRVDMRHIFSTPDNAQDGWSEEEKVQVRQNPGRRPRP